MGGGVGAVGSRLPLGSEKVSASGCEAGRSRLLRPESLFCENLMDRGRGLRHKFSELWRWAAELCARPAPGGEGAGGKGCEIPPPTRACRGDAAAEGKGQRLILKGPGGEAGEQTREAPGPAQPQPGCRALRLSMDLAATDSPTPYSLGFATRPSGC